MFDKTYLEPRLRHFRWPGINFVAVEVAKRIDPHDDLAGERFNEAKADGSTDWITDSFELQDDELGTDVGGSSFKDFLSKKKTRIFTYFS